jgi:hypothetical protein
MTKEKVKVPFLGQMEDNMSENGKVVSNTELVLISAIKEIVNKVFGKTVKKSNGWIMKMSNESNKFNLMHNYKN